MGKGKKCALLAAAVAATQFAGATVVLDASACPDEAKFIEESGFIRTLEKNMPKVIELLDGGEAAKNPIADVKLILVKDFACDAAAVAVAQRREITLGVSWARKCSREEVNGALAHEFAHVVQCYTENPPPIWLTEGIADWVRWFNIETAERRAFISKYTAADRKYDAS